MAPVHGRSQKLSHWDCKFFINLCLRCIFRIYWPNHITNEELLRRAEIEPVEIRIRRHKWTWIGHTLRIDENSMARMAMKWNPFDVLGRAPGGQCQCDLAKSSWARDKNENNSQKPHTMASRHCWCAISQRGLHTYIFGTNTRNRARPRTFSKLWSA